MDCCRILITSTGTAGINCTAPDIAPAIAFANGDWPVASNILSDSLYAVNTTALINPYE